MKKFYTKFISLSLIAVMLLSLVGCTTSPPPILNYKVSAGWCYYDLDDEIDITVRVGRDSFSNIVSEGDLHIKIAESPYYEIVSDDEIIIKDFHLDDYESTSGANYPINVKFTIKITETSYVSSPIVIKMKFARQNDEHGDMGYYDRTYNPDDEYFFQITDFMFISDDNGVILTSSVDSKREFFGTGYPFWLTRESLIFQSYNRQYKNGATVEDILDRLAYEQAEGSAIYGITYESERPVSIRYISPNMRAKIYLSTDSEIEKIITSDDENADILAITAMLDALVLGGKITASEAAEELVYIENNGFERVYSESLKFANLLFFDIPEGDEIYNHLLDLR